jgi:hypothetical protein
MSVYVIVCIDEYEIGCNAAPPVRGAALTMEKAEEKLQQLMKKYMTEYEEDLELKEEKKQKPKIVHGQYTVYGCSWYVEKTELA